MAFEKKDTVSYFLILYLYCKSSIRELYGSVPRDQLQVFLGILIFENLQLAYCLHITILCRHMDLDGDGKLNFIEFYEQAYDVFKNYVGFETAGADLPTAEGKFAELDVNKDRYAFLET